MSLIYLNHQGRPILKSIMHIPPISQEIINFPPYFCEIYEFPPNLVQSTFFCSIYIFWLPLFCPWACFKCTGCPCQPPVLGGWIVEVTSFVWNMPPNHVYTSHAWLRTA